MRGAFRFLPLGENGIHGRDRSLWRADSKKQTQLVVLPTPKGESHNGVDKRGKSYSTEESMERVRQTTSTCFYGNLVRLTSQKLLIAITEGKVMGGLAWTAVSHEDSRVLKMLSLWGNSIFGLLVHWTRSNRSQDGRAIARAKTIRKCHVLTSLSYPTKH